MIRISCKNERFTYDMYHIVKSFLPDAEISQKVDPEQEKGLTLVLQVKK